MLDNIKIKKKLTTIRRVYSRKNGKSALRQFEVEPRIIVHVKRIFYDLKNLILLLLLLFF